MGFIRSLLASASLVAYAFAQTAPVAFSSVPAVVVAGSSYNITWGGGDGVTPVTLTLRKGDPSSLKTIGILGDSLKGDWYLWNVSHSLATASDYTLQITQGQNEINYSGTFSIVGGTGSSSLSYSGLTSSTTSSNSTATITGTGAAGTMSGNSTMTGNSTITTASPRTITTMPATTVHSSGIGGAGSTTSSVQSTSAPNSAGVAQFGSSAALVMGLFVAIMCLS